MQESLRAVRGTIIDRATGQDPALDGGRRWLYHFFVPIQEGKLLEVLHTPNESVVVPVTRDGSVVLVKRKSFALGRSITSVLSSANPDNLSDNEIARRALNKITFPNSDDVRLEMVRKFNSWKYLTSSTTCFRAPVDMDSSHLAQAININDPETEGYALYTKEAFDNEVSSGAISDLRTIVAVNFALAVTHQGTAPPPGVHFDDEQRLHRLLSSRPPMRYAVLSSRMKESEWFPREIVDGVEIVRNVSDQAQALGVVEEKGRKSIVFLVEPFYAQAKYSLTFPSGGIENGDTAEHTAIKEMGEEAGCVMEDAQALTTFRYPMPLYLPVSSVVVKGKVVSVGDSVGGDESILERGKRFLVPVERVPWYIRNGDITDASVIAALLDWGRENGVQML